MTDSYTHDECCAAPLAAALVRGDLTKKTAWHCPDCGQRWTASEVGVMRHWEPECPVQVLRLRG